MFSNIFDIKEFSLNYFSSLETTPNSFKYVMLSRVFSDKVSDIFFFLYSEVITAANT